MSDKLGARTLSAAKWTYLATFVTVALQVVVTAVLARLVAPHAFGLVAMGLLVLRFGQYFAGMGVTQAIVQRKDLTPQHVAAGFWASAAVGGAFWALVAVAAPLLAAAFGAPDLTPILRWLGGVFFVTGLGTTASGLLRRAMRFRALAVADVVSYAVGYAALGVTLAAMGAGVWSLVAAGIGQAALASLSYNILAHPVARPVLRWAPYRELLGFGTTVSVVSFLEFLCGNLDTIVVGRLAGASRLGVYSRGLNLTSVPMYYLSTSLSKALLPSFSRIQEDRQRIGRVFGKVLLLAAAAAIPCAAGISGAARELVAVLLGSQWTAAIPVVRIAALAACAAMLSHFGGVTLEATAHLRDKMIMRGSQLAFFTVALVVLSRYGLVGFATAFALSEVTLHVALTWRTASLFEVSARRLADAYWPGLAAGLLVWPATYCESLIGISLGLPSVAVLAAQIATGVVLLAVVTLRIGQRRVVEVLEQSVPEQAPEGLIIRIARAASVFPRSSRPSAGS